MKKIFFFLILAVLKVAVIFGQQPDDPIFQKERETISKQIDSAFHQAQQAKYQLAKSTLAEALQHSKKIKDLPLIARTNYALANLNYKQRNFVLAEEYLQKILPLQAELSDQNIIAMAYLLQSKIDLESNQVDQVTANIDLATKIMMAEDEAYRQQLQASTEQISKLSTENSKQQRSIELNQLTIILGVTMILVLSLLTIAFFKNKNIRSKTTTLLLTKNRQLTREKNKAEKATLAKTEFLSTFTHELRTPIYAVTGLTHLLMDENASEEQKKHLHSLKFAGDHLLALINNILDFNKLEANRVILTPSNFDLREKIEHILKALDKFANEQNNELHLEFDESIPQKIKGDHVKLSQVIINLMSNAIRFTKDGDIWIRVKLINSFDHHLLINFEIEDNGIGIPEETKELIFENFTQGSDEINNRYGGTGLGLPIVKGILGIMGGEVKLESTVDVGTKFFFTLKFEKSKDLNLTGTEEKELEETNLSTWQSALKGRKILIVEDNKINQMITHKILSKHDIVCDLADDGETALEKTRKNTYDLILMDIHMPGISGIEATQVIRETDQSTPIIALTAVALDDNILNLLNKGFNDVIPKPYKIPVFFEKIYDGIYGAAPSKN